jgi:hypothetical protein
LNGIPVYNGLSIQQPEKKSTANTSLNNFSSLRKEQAFYKCYTEKYLKDSAIKRQPFHLKKEAAIAAPVKRKVWLNSR